MPKFKIEYKWSSKIDLGIVETKTREKAELFCKRKISTASKEVFEANTIPDGHPYYKIERIRAKRKRKNETKDN